MPQLDLSSLRQALSALKRGLARALAHPEDEELRDACIQRFEFTFEMCWKMLKRFLEVNLPNPREVDTLGYRDLFRVGAEMGRIDDPSAWFLYRDKRTSTWHVYDARKAAEVFSVLPQFAKDAETLLKRLEARNR